MAPSTLFVSNFPFATTESELRSFVEAHSPVRGIRIITDRQTGRSRGFAFIEVSSEADASAAIEALHDSMLNGRRIVVSHARGRPGGQGEKAPNAQASATTYEPFRHRIIIEWCENEGDYAAEVPDLGVVAHGRTITDAVHQVQARTRRSVAAPSDAEGSA